MMTLDRSTRLATGGVMLLVGASAIQGFARAFGDSEPLWAVAMLEAIVVIAVVFGVLFAFGLFRAAPGLTIACLAGAVLVPAGLSLLAQGLAVRQVLTSPIFLARIAAVGMLGLGAVTVTLGPDRRAWRRLVFGGVMTGGSLGVMAGGYALRASWPTAETGSGKAMLTIAAVVGVLILCGLFCIGVDLVIGAFERSTEPKTEPKTEPSSKAGVPA